MCSPTAVLPVKLILRTRGSEHSTSPNSPPGPGRLPRGFGQRLARLGADRPCELFDSLVGEGGGLEQDRVPVVGGRFPLDTGAFNSGAQRSPSILDSRDGNGVDHLARERAAD